MTRRKRNIIVMLIGVPIVLVMLIALGLVGFVGLRSTEIMERAYLKATAAQIQPYPTSALLLATFYSHALYPTIYPNGMLFLDCETQLSYKQVFGSDVSFEQITDYYAQEFLDRAWLGISRSEEVALADISPNIRILVNGDASDELKSRLLDSDLAYESIYTVHISYFTNSCFAIP